MIQNTSDAYKSTAQEFANQAIMALGDQVDAIILYGSVARGEVERDSDIDILVIGAGLSITRDKLSEICANFMYDAGYTFFISLAQFSRNEFRKLRESGSPFVNNVLAEGVILYDNGTYARVHRQATAIS